MRRPPSEVLELEVLEVDVLEVLVLVNCWLMCLR